jgi:hypothetical protein
MSVRSEQQQHKNWNKLYLNDLMSNSFYIGIKCINYELFSLLQEEKIYHLLYHYLLETKKERLVQIRERFTIIHNR